jgi:hypothetical protein
MFDVSQNKVDSRWLVPVPDDETSVFPEPDGLLVGIDRSPPTPEFAKAVASVDPAMLSGTDQVLLMRALQRAVSHLQSRMMTTMAAIVDTIAKSNDYIESSPEEAAAAEIGAALHLTRRAADMMLSDALDIDRRLPQLGDALEQGRLDLRRVRTMLRGTGHLKPAVAGQVVDEVLDDASQLTTGQIAARLRRTCIEVAPDDACDRYRFAVSRRRVVAEPEPDGTTTLYAPGLPPAQAAAAMARVNTIAKSLRRAGETRTMDQLRADVLVDMLTGTGQATRGGRGNVDIRADLASLAELSTTPGDLAGYGPVIAEITREVAKRQRHSAWTATVTDPDTGDIVATIPLRRRPTRPQRREVQARYPQCVWPGCRMPATQSDLDHRTPHVERGPTEPSNLAPLCRHHHRIRHQHGWHYTRTDHGDHQFTSPLGHTYQTRARAP